MKFKTSTNRVLEQVERRARAALLRADQRDPRRMARTQDLERELAKVRNELRELRAQTEDVDELAAQVSELRAYVRRQQAW